MLSTVQTGRALAIVLLAIPTMSFAQTRTDSPSLIADSIAKSLEGKTPKWLKEHRFPQSKFTYVRIQFDSVGRFGRGRSMDWATDYPDAELNLVATLGRLTKLDVSQPSRVMRLTDPALAEYPIICIGEPGSMILSGAEITALRKYLDAGGFLVMDDFWGEAESLNVSKVLKQVFPEQELVDLPLAHPLFHCVFDLQEKPQVLSIHAFLTGVKFERGDVREAHYRALQEPGGRIQVLVCQNTDLADGWERANVDPEYTREMSVAKAFPMGINLVFYALTQSKKAE